MTNFIHTKCCSFRKLKCVFSGRSCGRCNIW